MEHRLTEGDPAEEILRVAAALQCNLIVIGTHGRTGLGRLLMGSVAEEVLRKAVCPVLVVKAERASSSAEPETTLNDGEPIEVRPRGALASSPPTQTLVRSSAVEVVRLIASAGQKIPAHASKGAIIVHCLEGAVALTALGRTKVLEPGTLVHLPAGKQHALEGIATVSLVLLTILVPTQLTR